jgi:hypothetical protein
LLAPAPAGKLLQHVFRQHVTARESRAISHQLEQRILTIRANKRYVRQIND